MSVTVSKSLYWMDTNTAIRRVSRGGGWATPHRKKNFPILAPPLTNSWTRAWLKSNTKMQNTFCIVYREAFPFFYSKTMQLRLHFATVIFSQTDLQLFHYAGAFLLLLSLCRGHFCPCGESFWAAPPPFLRAPIGGLMSPRSLPVQLSAAHCFSFKKILYTPRVFHCFCVHLSLA